MDKRKPTPPEELPVLLSTYHFPGNVRELRALIFDAVSVHKGGKLSMAPFKNAILRHEADETAYYCASDQDESPFSSFPVLPNLSQASEILVAEALRRSRGNQGIAAGLLGISRQALNKRLKQQK
jgi:DNA-binding NtrC family response regulator